jgi:soluble cytochrome b562
MKSEIESLSEDKFRSTVESYLKYLHDQDERVRLVDQEELKAAIDKILKLLDNGDLDLAKAYFSALQERYEVVESRAGDLRVAVNNLKNYLKIIDGETI